jgi:hypothetical protein
VKNLIIFFFLLNTYAGFATNYYVKNGGSDSANGLSDETAWASVAKVVSSMQLFIPGDSILFKKGGTWIDALLTVGRAGSQGKNIVICSYGQGSKPVLSARPGMPVIQVTTSGRGYWTISNLDIRATTPPEGHKQSQGIAFEYWLADIGAVPSWEISNCLFNCSVLVSGPDVWIHHNIFAGDYNLKGYNRGGAIIVRGPEGDRALIEYNTIHGFTDRAVWILRGGSGPVIRYNTIYDILGSSETDHPGTGINLDGFNAPITGAKIFNNYIHDCKGLGISLENGFSTEAYNNTISNCNWGGFTIYWYPEHQGEPSDVNIHHNIVHNGEWGVLIYGASYWKIANNDFIKDDEQGSILNRNAVHVSSPSTYVSNGILANNIISGKGYIHAVKLPDTKNIWTLFDYNLIQPSGSEIVNRAGASLTLSQVQNLGFMSHGSTADPKFVNASSDWHLQEGSPAINAGTNLNYVRDFDNNRIDSLPDIGAFESGKITTTKINPPAPDQNMISYPDPAGNFLNIINRAVVSGKLNMKIFDYKGSLCMEKTLDASSGSFEIPLHLNPGLYIIIILSGSGIVFSQTFIKL